ncbi:MAG: DUF4338 domain-containing protein [Pirellulales bacterium]|jgi:hypothetical protein|nr:DUF4338 domain-containing protein [Pirellulales bacterium]|tara:strand:+ start:52 stop:936 length:885 start_codon:yes stop_codon:yes gene_type:complete
MNQEIKYRRMVATESRVEFIRELIAGNPGESRRSLSKKVCEAWNWVQPNGRLCDMVCRGFMLELHRAGVIRLPEKRCTPYNPLGAIRKKPPRVEVDTSAIVSSIKELKPFEIRQVRHTADEKLHAGLIEQYHYLGYSHPVGEQRKYVVYSRERPVGCFSFSAASRHVAARDRYIGWDAEHRKKNIHFIAYNTRFLLLPWVQVRHLASHLLGRIAKVVAIDWQRTYNHPIYYLETFVDTEKFSGTCYRAAGWVHMGETTGRGGNDLTNKVNRSIKAVWGYPLIDKFRERMCGGAR